METEILTEKERAELTGYKARGYQRRWREERQWHFSRVEALDRLLAANMPA